jgi:A/G-specific adenine glycosylase
LTLEADGSNRNRSLLSWYRANARDLPWRRTVDPYAILVSEVMLQQTQVSRVIPRYEAFLAEWPLVGDLADADTQQLLRAWSGLGYNARALRLREAARSVATDGWPTSIEGLRQLPGVGPYTAAAVASIAFGEEAAALDTNLRRILSRWAGEPLSGSLLESYAVDAVGAPAGDWNQALMDLGSAICTTRDPSCSQCPVEAWCLDPTVYEAPRRQSAFSGSHRQLRGALVRAHLAGSDLHEAGMGLDRPTAEIKQAIESLTREGLLT